MADPARQNVVLGRQAVQLLEHGRKELINIQGLFAQQAALEHGVIGFDRGVAHLAIAYDVCVGVYLDQGAALGHVVNVAGTHIGNFQIGTFLRCKWDQPVFLSIFASSF